MLAQIVDRGSFADWRALYALMAAENADGPGLRARVREVLFRVPTGYPFFWLAAPASLGEHIDAAREPRRDEGLADI